MIARFPTLTLGETIHCFISEAKRVTACGKVRHHRTEHWRTPRETDEECVACTEMVERAIDRMRDVVRG
jgi:hypothetical protein